MIVDLARFVEKERPYWDELDRELTRVTEGITSLTDLRYSRKLLSLFQRACADLGRLGASNAEPELRSYLESLVARGYAEIHSSGAGARGFRFWRWLIEVFPRTFRRHIWGFHASWALTLIGSLVGMVLIYADPYSREVIFPFSHLTEQTPSERVAEEESGKNNKRLENAKARFSTHLMANNIKVSINAVALGLTWGLGTVVLLFYNGVILGAVALDYIRDGQLVFLLGWLLPHGSIEIPAILLAGQGGFILGRALIGWRNRDGIRARLRQIAPDVVTLIGGIAIMLVWAGIVEAFFSQYHAPVLPYWVKISFGVIEIIFLYWFLSRCGRGANEEEAGA